MLKATTDKYLLTGKLCALISFLIGTLIFGIYFFSTSFNLLFVGYSYILIALVVNFILLTLVLGAAIRDKINRVKLIKTCGLMLLNIPVMLVYCWVAMIMLDTMRITVSNQTNKPITDINIFTQQSKHIDNLKSGESKTVWLKINSDCTIHINYMSSGHRKVEEVIGYVTTGMGRKMNYNVGGHNDNDKNFAGY